MKYFKIYDEITPEGQMYRLNGDTVEVLGEDGQYHTSIYSLFFGERGFNQLQQYVENFSDARMEDVECPVN